MYLDDAKTLAESSGLASPTDITPCTPAEVAALERARGCQLPQAYRDYLLWMGRRGGFFFQGTNCLYQDLPLEEEAARLLAYNHFEHELPQDAFVFSMHQGYVFLFFYISDGDNPPVYMYCEGETHTEFVKINDTFSGYILNTIKGVLGLFKRFPTLMHQEPIIITVAEIPKATTLPPRTNAPQWLGGVLNVAWYGLADLVKGRWLMALLKGSWHYFSPAMLTVLLSRFDLEQNSTLLFLVTALYYLFVFVDGYKAFAPTDDTRAP